MKIIAFVPVYSLVLAALLVMAQDPGAASASSTPMAPEVYSELQDSPDGTAFVIVLLKPVGVPVTSLAQRMAAVRQRQNRVLASLTSDEFALVARYETIAGMTGNVSAAGLGKLLQDPDVLAVGPDARIHADLDISVPFINADEVHSLNYSGSGYTGSGITVAVLDSGIDTDHPDLSDNIAPGAWHSLNNTSNQGPGAEDDEGHGTHVSGIITSNGTLAFVGVAPDTDVLAIKVLDSSGSGWMSDVVAGIDHVVQIMGGYAYLCAINLSLGSDALYSSCPCDNSSASTQALQAALLAAKNAGIASFAASGNDNSCNSMSSPACVSAAAAVAAVYESDYGSVGWSSCTDNITSPDRITCFSNRNGCNELAAPGAFIRSSRMGGGTISEGGTSAAAPHCSGVAALMCEASAASGGSLTPDDIVQILKTTGVPTIDSCGSSPNPVRVDALAAICEAGTEVGPGWDCNANGVADRCDLLSCQGEAWCDDCNGDGLLDACQSDGGIFGDPLTYECDDGTSEIWHGHDWYPASLAWINQFVIVEGAEVISAISLAWGVIPDGVETTVYLWSDPNQDGDPSDAQVLAQAASVSQNSGTDVFTSVPITPTYVGPSGTGFFAGAIMVHQGGQYPAAADTTSPCVGESWKAYDYRFAVDPNNLGGSHFPPEAIPQGNWLMRADAGVPGGGADCNANTIPDDCDIADCGANDPHPEWCAAGDPYAWCLDCNENGTPDGCEDDCNGNCIPDGCDIADGSSDDCNGNATPDDCDIAAGTSQDCQPDGIPDECQTTGAVVPPPSGNPCSRTATNGEPWCDDFETYPLGSVQGLNGWQGWGPGPGDPIVAGIVTNEQNHTPGGSRSLKIEAHDTVHLFDAYNQGASGCWVLSAWAYVPSGTSGTARFTIQSDYDGGGEGTEWAVELEMDPLAGVIYSMYAVPAWLPLVTDDWAEIRLEINLDLDLVTLFYSDVLLGTNMWSTRGGSLNIATVNLWSPDSSGFYFDDLSLSPTICLDCNSNGIPDDCDVAPTDPDGNGLVSDDCNFNGIPDECEPQDDCQPNGVTDICDIGSGASEDCNGNGTPDECEPQDDCQPNGVQDICDISSGSSLDCQPNGLPDECDIAVGTSQDCNFNGIPDECEPPDDCQPNGVPDICDLGSGASADCNGNGTPDECELAGNDCDANGVPDECDPDCNTNGTPDNCEAFTDCNVNGIPDECDIDPTDPDGNGQVSEDCNFNGVPDECEPDLCPPVPSPLTWETPPSPVSTSGITMTAIEATDGTPPVEYFFLYWPGSGNGGGNRFYDVLRTYTDSGLDVNEVYTYSVKARDSAEPRNYGLASTSGSAATYIEMPTGISFGAVDDTSIEVTADGAFTNLTVGSSGIFYEMTPDEGTGANTWVQTETITVTGLSLGTEYTFRVKSRNQDGAEMAAPWVGPAVQSTTGAAPCALLGDMDENGQVQGNDIGGFVRAKLGLPPQPGENQACANYGGPTLEDDIAAFVADLTGP